MRWFEVKFLRFLQVGESLFFSPALTGDVDLEALRNAPVPFAPNRSGKWSLHGDILSQKGWDWYIRCQGASQMILTGDPCHRGGRCAFHNSNSVTSVCSVVKQTPSISCWGISILRPYFCVRRTCPVSTIALSMRSGSLNVLVMPTFGYFGVRKC